MSNSKLPKVAVIYATGSTSPLTIRAASLGLCEVIILYDKDCEEKDITQIKLLNKYVKSFDISKLNDKDVEIILRNEEVVGILTFSEYKLEVTAKYCEMLGLVGHSIETVTALTDKYVQRELLSKDNINSLRYALVKRNDIESCSEKVGFPAIFKPRVGAGSKWTRRVCSLEELRNALEEFPSNIEYIIEEFLEGDDCFKEKFYGDYVSVESVHQDGKAQQVCITAKLPLTKDFAETGMFVPHPFIEELAQKIKEVESKAIKALGIRDGVTHTEIKLTSKGPRIIEVNGRLGGYVSEIIKRAIGTDLVKIALNVALGQEVNISVNSINSVVFQIFLTTQYVLDSVFYGIDGVEEVENIKGISHIQIRKALGESIDYRCGTESNIGIVYGEATDFEDFSRIIDSVKTILMPKFRNKGSEENDG